MMILVIKEANIVDQNIAQTIDRNIVQNAQNINPNDQNTPNQSRIQIQNPNQKNKMTLTVKKQRMNVKHAKQQLRQKAKSKTQWNI